MPTQNNYYYPNYQYPQYYSQYYYPYYAPYPPPKYYYEITKYATPFAPEGRKQHPKVLALACFLVILLGGLNLITGFTILGLAYDESHYPEVTLEGSIVEASTSPSTFVPISDVKITVVGTNLTTNSDGGGMFRISLPAGEYHLIFEKSGYATLNGAVVVGKYLDNHVNVEMKKGDNATEKILTSFGSFEDYMANMLASGTFGIFVGGFALISANYLRNLRYRSMGIVSGALGVLSIVFFGGLSVILLLVGVVSCILGLAVLLAIYLSSEMFLAQPETAASTNLL